MHLLIESTLGVEHAFDLAGHPGVTTIGLGLLGRTAIHPLQLVTVRAEFTPGADQVARAQEVVDA